MPYTVQDAQRDVEAATGQKASGRIFSPLTYADDKKTPTQYQQLSTSPLSSTGLSSIGSVTTQGVRGLAFDQLPEIKRYLGGDGKVKLEIPKFLAEDQDFLKTIQPLVDQKVTFADGKAQHSLLDDSVFKQVQDVAKSYGALYSNADALVKAGQANDIGQAKTIIKKTISALDNEDEIVRIPGLGEQGNIKVKDLFQQIQDSSADQARTIINSFEAVAKQTKDLNAATDAKIILSIANNSDKYGGQLRDTTTGEKIMAGLNQGVSSLFSSGPLKLIGRGLSATFTGEGNALEDARTQSQKIAATPLEGEAAAQTIGGVAGGIGNFYGNMKALQAFSMPAELIGKIKPIAAIAEKYPKVSAALGTVGREGVQSGVYVGSEAISGDNKEASDFVKDALAGIGISAVVPIAGKIKSTLAERVKNALFDGVHIDAAAEVTGKRLDDAIKELQIDEIPKTKTFKLGDKEVKLKFEAADLSGKDLATIAKDTLAQNAGAKELDTLINTRATAELSQLDQKTSLEFIDAMQRGEKATAQEILDKAGIKKTSVDDVSKLLESAGRADQRAAAIAGTAAPDRVKNYFPTSGVSEVQDATKGSGKIGRFTKAISSDESKNYQFLKDRIKAGGEFEGLNAGQMLAKRASDTGARAADTIAARKLESEGVLITQLKGDAAKVANEQFGGVVKRPRQFKDASGNLIFTKNEIAATPEWLRANGYEVLSSDNAIARSIGGFNDTVWVASKARPFLSQYDSYTPSPIAAGLKKTASAAQLIQNLKLSGGGPNTALNAFAALETFNRILSTGLNPKEMWTTLKSFARANSDVATLKYIDANKADVENLLKAGWLGSPSGVARHLGGDIKAAPSRISYKKISEELDDGIADAFVTSGVDKGLKDSVARTFNKADEAMGRKTFTNLLTSFQIDAGKAVYNKAIKKGLSEEEAWKAAADSVNKFWGLTTGGVGRLAQKAKTRGAQDLINNTLTTVFMAPKYRATNVGRLIDTLRLADARQWADPVWRAKNALQINTLKSIVGLFIAGNAYNKIVNDRFVWDNPTGGVDEVQFHMGDNVIGFNLLGSMGSFPRQIGRATSALTSGNVEKGVSEATGLLSVPLQPVARAATGKTYFGDFIGGGEGPPGIVDRVAYVAGDIVQHPFYNAMKNYVQGKDTKAIFDTLELPIRYRNEQIAAKLAFDKEVAPAIEELQKRYAKEVGKIDFNAENAQEEYDKITRELLNRTKDTVSGWADQYGKDVLNLSEQQRRTILSKLDTPGSAVGRSPDSYLSEAQSELKSAEKADLTKIARETGLPLDTLATVQNEFRNNVYGTPKQVVYEFKKAVTDRSQGDSLKDVKKSYETLLDSAYKRKDFKEVERLTREYNGKLDSAIAPLIEKYGPEILANNYQVTKDLAELIKIPYSDLKKAGRISKNELKTNDVRQFLQERYGVGGRDKQNLPSDREVQNAILKANESLRSGNIASARFQANNSLRNISLGKLYASPEDYVKLTNIITR